MRKILFIITALLGISVVLKAQVVIKGKVSDIKGIPVIGAVIMEVGNNTNGAVTDIDGNWSLALSSVDESTQITVSCIGYVSRTVTVRIETSIEIVLEEDAIDLEETVIVGYGSMRKSDLTGSVTSVKLDEGQSARSTSLDQVLRGRAAGVQVLSSNASPDAGVNIRIRGMSSFNGSTDPLYVVDGVIINGQSESVTTISHGADAAGSDEAVNGLTGINPQDIERVEILKDASATAIYGSQGANGVVLITTKSASREEPMIEFSAGVDISSRYKKMDMLSFDEYISFADALHDAGVIADGTWNGVMGRVYADPDTRGELLVTPVDWQDYMMRTAVGQRYYFSISGKPGSMSYRVSLGYARKEGVVRNTDVDQYTMKLNLFKYIIPQLKFGATVSFSFVNSNLTQGVSTSRIASSSSIMRSILMSRPYRTAAEEDVENEDEVATPDKWLSDFVNKRRQFRLIPSIYGEYSILRWLKFKSTFGGEWSSSEYTKFKSVRMSTTTGNISAVSHNKWMKFNWDNMFLLDKSFGKHRISGTVGVTVSMYEGSTQTVEGWGVAQYKAHEQTINANPYSDFAYSARKNSLMSVLARAIYSYDDRYVVTATYRLDGSSKFKGSNRWCSFPSFALAWRINREKWFPKSQVSMLKIRAGWGQVGNQAISDYQTLSVYGNVRLGDHSSIGPGYEVGIFPSNVANPNLKWETTEQFDAGVDFEMWGGRLSIVLDAYYKKTRDLLQQKTIALSSGYSSMWVNSGAIRNCGAEMSLDITPVVTHDFTWTLTGNISMNRNRILSVGGEGTPGEIYFSPGQKEYVKYFYGSPMTSSGTNMGALNIFIEGFPMGLFYAYKTDGIVQKGETGPGFTEGETLDEGHIKYVDVNSDGVINELDRTIVGNPNPDFTYGLGTSLSYRNLTLSMNFTGVYGNDIYNLNNAYDCRTDRISYNVRRCALTEAWSESNPEGKYPAIGKSTASDTRYLDTNIEDGSYLRLSDVSIAWRIPIKKKWMKTVTLSVSAGNLFVISKYSGWDPEVNSFGSNVKRMGIDLNSYPSSRTFSMDVKLTF